MYIFIYLFSPYLTARRAAAAGTGQPRRDQPSMQIQPMCRPVGPIRGKPALLRAAPPGCGQGPDCHGTRGPEALNLRTQSR